VNRGQPGRGDLDERVAEVVVHDPDDRRAVVVADVQVREGCELVVECDALWVAVVRPQQDAAPVGANGGVRAVVADHRRLAEAGGRRGDHYRAHQLDAHYLHAHRGRQAVL